MSAASAAALSSEVSIDLRLFTFFKGFPDEGSCGSVTAGGSSRCTQRRFDCTTGSQGGALLLLLLSCAELGARDAKLPA